MNTKLSSKKKGYQPMEDPNIDVNLLLPKCSKTTNHARANYNYLYSKSNIRTENGTVVSPASCKSKYSDKVDNT